VKNANKNKQSLVYTSTRLVFHTYII